MTGKISLMSTIVILPVLGLAGWLAWFYAAPTTTLNWPHPGQPTTYFSWHHRPTVVRSGLNKDVRLNPGTTYDFSVAAPRPVTQGRLSVSGLGDVRSVMIDDHTISPRPITGGWQVQSALDWTGLTSPLIRLAVESAGPVVIRNIRVTLER